MQSRNSKFLIATILLTLLLSTSVIRAHAFTNGQSASLVIGQKDFTSGSAGRSQSGLAGPTYAIFDSSGNLWVGDFQNSRVLEFKPPFSTGMNASLVIGQQNFETNTPATSQSGLKGQGLVLALAFDSSGNLWVGDPGNNRVLEFKPPFSTGMPASLVIGQKDFTSAFKATTKDGLSQPVAVAFDHSDNLWVDDLGNFRVLEFNPPFSSGMSASLVIGQPDFKTHRPSMSQSGLSTNDVGDLAIDPSGNVCVGDFYRLLEFRAPFSNGMNASVVIGQADFAGQDVGLGRTGLSGCCGITTDSAGNLWVADSGNNRLLEFEPPFSNGMGASLVIGQQDFNSSRSATTQSGFSFPDHPGFDSSGNLWVPDSNNNRVLEFSSSAVPEFPTASLAIIAVASLAVVALVLRRFPLRRVETQ